MQKYLMRAKPRPAPPDASVIRTDLVISEDGGPSFTHPEDPASPFRIATTTVQFSIKRVDVNSLGNQSPPSAERTYLVADVVIPNQPPAVDVEFLGTVDE